MKYRFLSVVLTATVLLLNSGLSLAVGTKTDDKQAATTKAVAIPQSAKGKIGKKHKHAARIKLVDINHASKEELKKLPGIGDAEADKIISVRPLGSKTSLLTTNIIPKETYVAIDKLIVCKLTQNEVDKIMAQGKQQNKKK